MTREEAKQNAAVMLAWADGKPLQIRIAKDPSDQWSNVSCAKFNFEEFEYRIKPEPRRFWIVLPAEIICETGGEAQKASEVFGSSDIIEVQEVLK